MASWTFPLTNGGKEDGFNDPGVNTFTGDFEKYVAREAIQNVLDAKREEADNVRIRFDLDQIPAADLPGHAELAWVMNSCREYYKADKKAAEFFDHASGLLAEKKIAILSIRDFNTTGLIGSDSERSSNWYSLIRSVGASQKGDDAGGSFGIGKNAPFAASALRAVYYSTKLADDAVAFQGVARLVTHESASGEPTQGTGYFGNLDAKSHPQSIRTEAEIPALFKRTEQGTTIHIAGYMGEVKDGEWKKQLERATLEHFWPAVSWGHLVVEIGSDIVINAETLPARMEKALNDYPDFREAAYAYYDAYTAQEHVAEADLKKLKQVRAYFKVNDVRLPNRVAMIRKTGMVIYTHTFRGLRLKFAGAFICDNEVGNTLLRSMEPPRHNEWDVNLPYKGANRAVQEEYRRWLRDRLVDLAPKLETKTVEVDELADYLPDTISSEGGKPKVKPDSPDSTQGPTTGADTVQEPEFEVVPTPKAKQPEFTPGPKPVPPGEEPKPKDPPKPTDTNTDNKPPKPPQPAEVFAKGFADVSKSEYVVYLLANQETTVDISINAVGEDAFTEEIHLQEAQDRATTQPLEVSGNKIKAVELQGNQPRRLALRFADSTRRAVTIATHEI